MWSFSLVFVGFETFCWKIWNQKRTNSGDIHWNFWTNIKTFYARNNIFKKRIPNMRFLNHIYSGPNFALLETGLGCLSPSANHGGQHFCSASRRPHHGKVFYGPASATQLSTTWRSFARILRTLSRRYYQKQVVIFSKTCMCFKI